MEAYDIRQAEWDEFSAAREQFAKMIGGLSRGKLLKAEHGEVEQWLFSEGFELLRLSLQGHLDLRARQEQPRAALTGADGVTRTHRRTSCTRPLESLFGEVTVPRMGYSYPGAPSLFPLDAELNLPPGKYSHGLQRVLSDEAAKGSFEEATETLRKMTGGAVPKRQAEELAPAIAADFDAFYATRNLGQPEETNGILQMSTDGKGVVMREEALRECTRLAAERARAEGKRGARLTPGEKPNRKRMSTVAAVYSVAPNVRTPEDILDVLRADSDQPRPARPRPENKRAWASLKKDPDEVIAEMFAEAERRDPAHLRPWALVVDGAEHQLRLIKAEAQRHSVELTIVADFIHGLEYVWKAAHGFFPVGSDEAEDWVAKTALELLRGNAGPIAGGMRRKATLHKIKGSKRKAINKCAGYLLKHKDHMRYDEYLAAGLPIASGVIEGACRYLVKDRMEITGARWGLDDAEAVLKLRALRSSGDLEEYWRFHQVEEHKRHHRSRCYCYPRLEAVS